MSEHDFSMQELANIVGKQSVNVDRVLGRVEDLSLTIDDTRNEMRAGFKAFANEIKDIKDNYEITTQQAKNIRVAVHKQVCKLLGVSCKSYEYSLEDRILMDKYGSLFHSRCYSEVARKGHLASPYASTTNQNYIPAIADIEAWTPSKGIEGLKKEADDSALARKIALEQGYE